jgi:hypothetical protein
MVQKRVNNFYENKILTECKLQHALASADCTFRSVPIKCFLSSFTTLFFASLLNVIILNYCESDYECQNKSFKIIILLGLERHRIRY